MKKNTESKTDMKRTGELWVGSAIVALYLKALEEESAHSLLEEKGKKPPSKAFSMGGTKIKFVIWLWQHRKCLPEGINAFVDKVILDDIHKEKPRVSRAVVSRTLQVLKEYGLIVPPDSAKEDDGDGCGGYKVVYPDTSLISRLSIDANGLAWLGRAVCSMEKLSQNAKNMKHYQTGREKISFLVWLWRHKDDTEAMSGSIRIITGKYLGLRVGAFRDSVMRVFNGLARVGLIEHREDEMRYVVKDCDVDPQYRCEQAH